MTDFLDEKRDEIDDRLAELKPLIEEYNRLLAAAAALRGVDGSSSTSAVMSAPSRTPSEDGGVARVEEEDIGGESEDESAPAFVPTAAPVSASAPAPAHVPASAPAAESVPVPAATPLLSARASSAPRRAGRPKGSGTRAAEALRIVREHPGVTIPELADRMGIKQNYLYRVLPELVQEGKIAKQGRGWHPRAA